MKICSKPCLNSCLIQLSTLTNRTSTYRYCSKISSLPQNSGWKNSSNTTSLLLSCTAQQRRTIAAMTDFAHLLRVLVLGEVDFILVGGVAATVHGAARLTQDIDVVYSRRRENRERLVRALQPLQPYPRAAPPGLPFLWDQRTVEQGLNFTLTTTHGALDLLGEITGGGAYEDLLPHTFVATAFDLQLRCLDLESLIRVKRAAGRPKDFEAIAELELILDQRRK